MSRPDHIVNIEDVEQDGWTQGNRLALQRRQLGAAAGGKMIGCSLLEVPKGKQPFPYHYHTANEESIYVLEGEGSLRHPDGETPLRPCDYVAFRVGAEGAHAITATTETLKFLCFSTMIEPEISVMPDSGKYGLFAGSAPGGKKEDRTVFAFHRQGDNVHYFDGEPD